MTPDLTLDEVAAQKRVTPRWLREFVRRKHIRVLRSGRIVRFDRFALDDLEQAMRATHPAPMPIPKTRAARPRAKDDAYAEVMEMMGAALRKKKA